MEFATYLEEKKIDSKAFEKAEPEQWTEFERIFMQMHPKSFTAQKLFLINGIRRKYPLKVAEGEEGKEVKKKVAKPVMKPTTKPKPKKPGKPVIKKPKIK